MFSPSVKTDVKQAVAMGQYDSIEDICNELNDEAIKRNFLREPVELNESVFNDFIKEFASTNGMQARTVQPFVWSFSIEGQKLFDDGVIELETTGGKHFICTKVDESKITQLQKELPVEDNSSSDSENLFAHRAWLNRLNKQIDEWGDDLKSYAGNERAELSVKLKALKSLLDTLKSSSMNVSKEAIVETERQWSAFQVSLEKIKKTVNKSSQ